MLGTCPKPRITRDPLKVDRKPWRELEDAIPAAGRLGLRSSVMPTSSEACGDLVQVHDSAVGHGEKVHSGVVGGTVKMKTTATKADFPKLGRLRTGTGTGITVHREISGKVDRGDNMDLCTTKKKPLASGDGNRSLSGGGRGTGTTLRGDAIQKALKPADGNKPLNRARVENAPQELEETKKIDREWKATKPTTITTSAATNSDKIPQKDAKSTPKPKTGGARDGDPVKKLPSKLTPEQEMKLGPVKLDFDSIPRLVPSEGILPIGVLFGREKGVRGCAVEPKTDKMPMKETEFVPVIDWENVPVVKWGKEKRDKEPWRICTRG
ncbi:hypothetical protein DFH27DRAFT_521150 [Peziza echinospora]|nr:hypothetical protein DFH27DRAFT_521150 [Peziza echinospora]